MKRYLVVDCMSDHKELMDLKGIKDLLIEEVTEDIYNNTNEREIVVGNVKILKKLALDTMTLKEIEEVLGGYSFKIIDLLSFQMDLCDVATYFYGSDEKFNEFEEKIRNGVENNE